MEKVQFAYDQPIRIYEGKNPESPKEVLLTPFLSEDPLSHDSVIIFPGGGYEHVSMQKEGSAVAQALNNRHLNAFVLDYRVSPAHRNDIIRDAVRAVQFVRYHSPEALPCGRKLAVMGFSAGGHLAITEVEHWQEIRTGDDDIARESGRPDALVLCYPVITFAEPFAHRNSRLNFLGPDDAEQKELRDAYSAEKHASPDLPSAFIWHCRGDASVPVENSLMFSDALNAAGVDHKLTLYSGGAHGIGLASDQKEISGWFSDCISWLREQGFG